MAVKLSCTECIDSGLGCPESPFGAEQAEKVGSGNASYGAPAAAGAAAALAANGKYIGGGTAASAAAASMRP